MAPRAPRRRPLPRPAAGAAVLVLAALAVSSCLGGSPAARFAPLAGPPPPGLVPGAAWARLADPAASGWSLAGLAQARRLWEDNSGTTAVLIVHGGAVVDAWGPVAQPVKMRSIRKSLFASLLGMAVAEGRLRLDATLAELGIDETTPLSEAEKRATVADLLTSRSGVYLPAAKETPANRRRRPARGSHPAGSFFYYNNWDFNALATIYAGRTGGDLFADFEARVARPIGMEDFRRADHTEYVHARSSRHPAYQFRLSARDLARYGLLWLRGGRWGERQVVPAEWVAQATAPHATGLEDGLGYGYLWWVMPADGEGAVREQAFYADGGGFLWVVPELDLVVVAVYESGLLLLDDALGRLPDGGQTWRMFATIAAAAPR
jgi:CubicO group peptidase (beta-lactamase class C family)